MRVGHVAQLCCIVCYPAQDLSHVGGRHACLQPLPAKALVPCMLQQGLIGTGAPVRHSRALSIYQSRSHNFPAILVNPGNPSLFDYSTGNPTQSESIHHYYILLNIIKIIYIFNSFTCSGHPDPIDQGSFKFACRNLVGLPILMPLIDTN